MFKLLIYKLPFFAIVDRSNFFALATVNGRRK